MKKSIFILLAAMLVMLSACAPVEYDNDNNDNGYSQRDRNDNNDNDDDRGDDD